MTDTTTAVKWNPAVEAGTKVRVFEYYSGANYYIHPEPGYHVRTATSHIDSDGDLALTDNHVNGGMYAHRWTLDEDAPAEPEAPAEEPLKVGDWVKVTDVLPLAIPAFRVSMVGSIRRVAELTSGEVRVDVTPEERRALNISTTAVIAAWEKAEDPNAVEWNPVLTPGTLVWVYGYANGGGNLSLSETSYHQRIVGWASNSESGTAIGVDSQGMLHLRPTKAAPDLPWVASKWCRPPAGATPWNPAVLAGTEVKVYEYASTAHEPSTAHFDIHGAYDLRTAVFGDIDSDGDLRLTFDAEMPGAAYAKRWMLATPEPEVQPVTGQAEPNWGQLILQLRAVMDEHANDPNSGDAWCSEYESTLDSLFGWSSERNQRVTYEVKVRLRRSVDADEVVNAEAVFGGYNDDVSIDPDSITIDGEVRVNVEGTADEGPDRDEVENVLDNAGYKYDSFDVLDFEPID